MTAPLFNFSPRLPWSGDVIQDIEPRTNWFFGAIAPEAGNARLEQHLALDVASYGKQLSAVLDLLHGLVEAGAAHGVDAEVVERFERLHQRVSRAKAESKADYAQAARLNLERLRRVDRAEYERLLASLQAEAGADDSARPRARRPSR